MNAVYVDFMLANRKDNHEEKRRRRHVGGCIWLKLLLLVSTLTANYELTTAQYKPDVKCGFQENAVFKFKTELYEAERVIIESPVDLSEPLADLRQIAGILEDLPESEGGDPNIDAEGSPKFEAVENHPELYTPANAITTTTELLNYCQIGGLDDLYVGDVDQATINELLRKQCDCPNRSDHLKYYKDCQKKVDPMQCLQGNATKWSEISKLRNCGFYINARIHGHSLIDRYGNYFRSIDIKRSAVPMGGSLYNDMMENYQNLPKLIKYSKYPSDLEFKVACIAYSSLPNTPEEEVEGSGDGNDDKTAVKTICETDKTAVAKGIYCIKLDSIPDKSEFEVWELKQEMQRLYESGSQLVWAIQRINKSLTQLPLSTPADQGHFKLQSPMALMKLKSELAETDGPGECRICSLAKARKVNELITAVQGHLGEQGIGGQWRSTEPLIDIIKRKRPEASEVLYFNETYMVMPTKKLSGEDRYVANLQCQITYSRSKLELRNVRGINMNGQVTRDKYLIRQVDSGKMATYVDDPTIKHSCQMIRIELDDVMICQSYPRSLLQSGDENCARDLWTNPATDLSCTMISSEVPTYFYHYCNDQVGIITTPMVATIRQTCTNKAGENTVTRLTLMPGKSIFKTTCLLENEDNTIIAYGGSIPQSGGEIHYTNWQIFLGYSYQYQHYGYYIILGILVIVTLVYGGRRNGRGRIRCTQLCVHTNDNTDQDSCRCGGCLQLDLPEWLKTDYDYMALFRRPKKATKSGPQPLVVKTKEVEARFEEGPRPVQNTEGAMLMPGPAFNEAIRRGIFSLFEQRSGQFLGQGECHPPPTREAKWSEPPGANGAKQAAVANFSEVKPGDKLGNNMPDSSGQPSDPRDEKV